MTTPARFFDGKVAKGWPVLAAASFEGVRILDAEGAAPRAVWAVETLQVTQAESRNLPLILTSSTDPDARLVIAVGAGAAVLGALPMILAGPERLSTDPAALAGWAVGALAVAGLFAVAIPWLAETAAPHAPQTWRDQLGRYVKREVTRGQRPCETKAGTAALNHLMAQVTRAPVHLSVADSKTVNAFAAPGGYVVVYRGMIEESETPAELASVLAHEYGHVEKEHATASAIRILGLTLAGQVMLGIDAGKMAPAAAFYSLTYNRRDELEADKIAAGIMRRLGDAGAMAALFKRFAAKDGASGQLGTYFSSHPGWTERIAAVTPEAAEAPVQLLSDDEWKALRNICGDDS